MTQPIPIGQGGFARKVADTAAERDRLKEVNAELLAALEMFTAAMDMNLGSKHETAICYADDMARAVIAKAKEPTP